MAEDFAERHVARWRDHWIDIDFDEPVELAMVRISRIKRHTREATRRASAEVGLQVHEYETLHALMIRDTPGTASPSELAQAADVSPAGMTGRLDSLEKAGLIKRRPSRTDRRSVTIEATSRGADVWRKAMALRGEAERNLLGALTPKELAALNRLLRKLAVVVDAEYPAEP
ncbi:MarR family winged helix-turn-helix transcriptional regulator [Kineosporia babensis]|uniref:MarR family transcriptional regulator n=1 Tax=Kineosporia babensis TaxID=499548 RepID=A0A9X1SUW2_9ACTN|nr:MarR family transcriptional regulator [Kineosporia babensis]MCD5313362.1 MarR family transcriptional regulator [Kineosporia babensis]